MACGGCGKRKPKITINRKGVVSKGIKSGRSGPICPACGSALRYVHKLDRSKNKIARMLYCIRPACRYQKST